MNSPQVSLDGIAGIDEAGRGPMIGPLVVCGVLIGQGDIVRLEEMGLKDSKLLSPKRRVKFASEIEDLAKRVEIYVINAETIDFSRRRGITLNNLEVDAFAEVAKNLCPAIVFMDAADVNNHRFGDAVGEKSGLQVLGCEIVSEHKADEKYPIVSAASILAKVERDRTVKELHTRHGDFGSGYPSDPKTIGFVEGLVKSGKDLPDIVRKSWKSTQKIVAAYSKVQMTLDS